MQTYPLKFKPILKERIWGGNKLHNELGKPTTGFKTGESWEVSAVPGDVSEIANGVYSGEFLDKLIDRFPEALLGNSVLSRFGKTFPILIKFIDAAADLSIQVHPDDQLAKQRHNSFGKTEMWYVMDADPGARLLVDFNQQVTPEEYKKRLANNTLLDLMNKEEVREGDTFFINAGKLHAIGAGVMLAEIQQTSDVTYRVYDYDREDAKGNKRQLHTEQALDAIDFSLKQDFRVAYDKVDNTANPMVNCTYFNTQYLPINGRVSRDYSERDAFSILIAVDGNVDLSTPQARFTLKKGETCLIPAALDSLVLESDRAKLLEVTL
ncbi:MAG: class I mannose-6-phosphate isomerase [Eudoraea sp.]|nr:class I mannose-6-phosphate isomerase [Eudoraea sp.]NNJ40645.1 class I mannose-6-phosphate isomerase [Eudoraea sp.]